MNISRKWLVLIVGLMTLFAAVVVVILITEKESIEAPPPPPPHMVYGINADSLDIITRKVESGQNLSQILSGIISPVQIDQLVKSTKDVFDVRKIRPGNKITFLLNRDSIPKTLYFVYEINAVDYVLYDLRDTLKAKIEHKKVTKERKSASGTITTSLWNTFTERNLDVNLALSLSDVFAWTVDFYGIQKGDHFKVIYDELSVEGTTVGSDKVLAAVFSTEGKDQYAFWFEADSIKGYFDQEGKSLRRAFLKAPLHFSRISSRYSKSRLHPILRIRRPHYGVDYSAPSGTPVVSLGDGKVVEAGWKGGYGRFVSVRHNSVYTSTYAHLSGYGKGIKAGSRVQQGQVIGYVGSSGLSTGPHLDFRVYKNGAPVDPLRIESPPTRPVDAAYKVRYDSLVKDMTRILDTIK